MGALSLRSNYWCVGEKEDTIVPLWYNVHDARKFPASIYSPTPATRSRNIRCAVRNMSLGSSSRTRMTSGQRTYPMLSTIEPKLPTNRTKLVPNRNQNKLPCARIEHIKTSTTKPAQQFTLPVLLLSCLDHCCSLHFQYTPAPIAGCCGGSSPAAGWPCPPTRAARA